MKNTYTGDYTNLQLITHPNDLDEFTFLNSNEVFYFSSTLNRWVNDINGLTPHFSLGIPSDPPHNYMIEVVDLHQDAIYTYDYKAKVWNYSCQYVPSSNTLTNISVSNTQIATTSYVTNNLNTYAGILNIGSPLVWTDSVKFSIIQDESNEKCFHVINMTTKHRDLYKWIMGTEHEVEIEEKTDYSLQVSLKLTFADAEGAVDFKLTWFGVYD